VEEPGSGLDGLGYDECLERLGDESIGRIALVVNELLVVVPVNYRLVQVNGRHWIVFRTELGGLLDRPDTHAAFEIDHTDPERRTGWSVLVQGMVARVDPDSADVRERFDPVPWPRSPRERWMAVEPFSITGRRIALATD
jgi:hypothetical protein